MSTRYVWGKYTSSVSWGNAPNFATDYLIIPGLYAPSGSSISNWNAGYIGSGITFSDGQTNANYSKGTASITNPKIITAQTKTTINSATRYYALEKSGNTFIAWAQDGASNGNDDWYIGPVGSSTWGLYCIDKNSGSHSGINWRELTGGVGDSLGIVSSTSSTAYPTESGGGIFEDNWYIYKGSDNIDPRSISYPTSGISTGDSITVNITESNSKVYGGTVNYTYQYRLNGGSWTTISTTTATSINFTIPNNATSIQFRANAKDDAGFTSSTYVTGLTITIETSKFWVGINGKARESCNMWVGVNGKARKVKAAWVGVNGKARKFM